MTNFKIHHFWNQVRLIMILVWISLFNSTQLQSQEGLPFIYNFGSDDYSAGIQNWDITQDSDGRIYIANNFGLLVYDGKNWQLVNTADGTKLRSVLAMDDKVYAGYQKNFGYYMPDELGRLTYTSLANLLPSQHRDFDEIWKIYSYDNAIFFCGFDYIFKYQDGEIKTIVPNGNLEISFLNQMELLVQVNQKGLSRLNSENFELLPKGDFFTDKRISGIVPFDKDTWLITCFNSGAFLYSSSEIKPFTAANETSIDNLIINSLLRLSNGSFAIGTQNKGLLIINKKGEVLTKLNKFRGLIDNTVNSMFEDKQGNLWLSMNNGISRVSINSPFTILDYRLGIDGAGYATYQADNGLYLGTNNGLFLYQDGEAELIKGTEGQVYSIQKLDKHLFIGHNNGPMLIENNQAQLLSDEKGAWLFRNIPGRPNEYLIGTYLGLRKLIYQNKRFEINEIAGFDESSRVMHFEDKTLWVTQGYKGAYKLTFNENYTRIEDFQLYNSNKGFPTDILINVFQIGDQLVFGSERGVFQYNEQEDQFTRIEKYENALGENISLVDIDADELNNQYYIATDKIGKLSSRTGNEFIHKTSTFNPLLNRWNDDLGNISVVNANNILIGGREGFIHYAPDKDIPTTENFSIQFNKIILNQETDSLIFGGYGNIRNNGIALAYKNNNLTFDFAATHYGSENEMEYAYRLENFSNDWSEWTSDTKQSFTNLHESNYLFEVKARNIYGQETEPIRFEFGIKPPIYRTKLAYSLYVGGSLALLFLGFKTLDRKHKQEREDILINKNKVINEKEKEIKTVAEKSESEIIKLRNEKLQTELKLKNQALTSSAMNLIQKNQLLGQIKNTLKSMSDEAQDKAAFSKLQRIVKSIDRDLSASEEWEQFEKHFDQVHGQFITRLKKQYPDLTPQELKFSAYLRMNLNTKEMANLLGISVRGVEIGRYRVRKKLSLERKDNLSDFILRF